MASLCKHFFAEETGGSQGLEHMQKKAVEARAPQSFRISYFEPIILLFFKLSINCDRKIKTSFIQYKFTSCVVFVRKELDDPLQQRKSEIQDRKALSYSNLWE